MTPPSSSSGGFLEWSPNNLKQRIRPLGWSVWGRQDSNWGLFLFW